MPPTGPRHPRHSCTSPPHKPAPRPAPCAAPQGGESEPSQEPSARAQSRPGPGGSWRNRSTHSARHPRRKGCLRPARLCSIEGEHRPRRLTPRETAGSGKKHIRRKVEKRSEAHAGLMEGIPSVPRLQPRERVWIGAREFVPGFPARRNCGGSCVLFEATNCHPATGNQDA